MNIDALKHFMEQLRIRLQQISDKEYDEISKAEKSVGICSATLLELRNYVNHSDFKNQQEEICFFKEIKPYALGKYLYYSKLWEILIRQPITSIRRRKKYLRQMISETQRFLKRIPSFIFIIGAVQLIWMKNTLFARKLVVRWIVPGLFMIRFSPLVMIIPWPR